MHLAQLQLKFLETYAMLGEDISNGLFFLPLTHTLLIGMPPFLQDYSFFFSVRQQAKFPQDRVQVTLQNTTA